MNCRWADVTCDHSRQLGEPGVRLWLRMAQEEETLPPRPVKSSWEMKDERLHVRRHSNRRSRSLTSSASRLLPKTLTVHKVEHLGHAHTCTHTDSHKRFLGCCHDLLASRCHSSWGTFSTIERRIEINSVAASQLIFLLGCVCASECVSSASCPSSWDD